MNNQDKKKEDKKEEISLEDLVEKERAALGPKQTKVTLETFLAWKKRKLREREESNTKENTRKQAAFKAGRSVGVCNIFFRFFLFSKILNKFYNFKVFNRSKEYEEYIIEK